MQASKFCGLDEWLEPGGSMGFSALCLPLLMGLGIKVILT